MSNSLKKSKPLGKNYKTLEEFGEALEKALEGSGMSVVKRVELPSVTNKPKTYHVTMK